MAGGPSAIRLTHSTWIGEKGTGNPNRLAPRMVLMAAQVGGELEPHELDDVGVDGPAPLDGGHDGGEVVVGEHHVGRPPW